MNEVEEMQERTQRNIEEFSRLQDYMLLLDTDNEAYKKMLIRYNELKALLQIDGVNITNIDRITK